MQVTSHRWSDGWDGDALAGAHLVLVFGRRPALEGGALAALQALYEGAPLVGCTTAAAFSGHRPFPATALAIRFASGSTRVTAVPWEGAAQTASALIGAVSDAPLGHLLAFVTPEGTGPGEMVDTLAAAGLRTSGGLASGEGDEVPAVVIDGQLRESACVAIAFGGERLQTGFGVGSGWRSFGAALHVPRAEGRWLFEVGGEPALQVLRRYLATMPEPPEVAARRFAFEVQLPDERLRLIRTIQGIDEERGAILLAAEVPPGSSVRVMRTQANLLANGATDAANAVTAGGSEWDLALGISCVRRREIMGPRFPEEAEAVALSLGSAVPLAGFYANGEIAPVAGVIDCTLHNETFTLFTLRER